MPLTEVEAFSEIREHLGSQREFNFGANPDHLGGLHSLRVVEAGEGCAEKSSLVNRDSVGSSAVMD